MGHSAGGHLALLYAYKNPTQIDLVISEAGPTHFVDYNNDIIVNNGDIFSMTGIAWNANGEYSNEDKRLLKQASPYWIVEGTSDKSILPYTILAYGNLYDENNNLTGTDSIVPYAHATALVGVLRNDGYNLIPLFNIKHSAFGSPNDKNETVNNTVNPQNTLNSDVDSYYTNLRTVLSNL